MTVKYEGSVPKTLRAWCDKHPERVKAIGPLGDQPGYDALLRPGWRRYDDLVHGIIESTATDTLMQLQWAVPCDCAECASLKEKERAEDWRVTFETAARTARQTQGGWGKSTAVRDPAKVYSACCTARVWRMRERNGVPAHLLCSRCRKPCQENGA